MLNDDIKDNYGHRLGLAIGIDYRDHAHLLVSPASMRRYREITARDEQMPDFLPGLAKLPFDTWRRRKRVSDHVFRGAVYESCNLPKPEVENRFRAYNTGVEFLLEIGFQKNGDTWQIQ